ncbi:MAG: hypothetical protein AAF628_26575 [Planctomycetota bacterium]
MLEGPRHGDASRSRLGSLLSLALVAGLIGCAAPPDLTGYPVNTPKTYSENKAFFVERLSSADQFSRELVGFSHLYEVNPEVERADDVISHNDPISVVLQGVRVPEDIGSGTRDIAVVLDIETANDRGTTTLIAFYQRDVPAGQMLNFNNLLVYAEPQWDSRHAPYFRVRILDVKAERNRRSAVLLQQVSNLSAAIGGTIPHPVIPLVQTAIDAASLVLSNQRNEVILDYQIQFYGANHRGAAGGATLGALLAGQWVVMGRARGASSDFWRETYYLDRKTDQILYRSVETAEDGTEQPSFFNLPVPYVSMVLLKADAEVPRLVLDRSQSLLELLSTPAGKSDLDMLEFSAENLTRSIDAFMVERRLRRYRSTADVQQLVDSLSAHDSGTAELNNHELQRLLYVLRAITPRTEHQPNIKKWVEWWTTTSPTLELAEDSRAPLGIRLQPKQ